MQKIDERANEQMHSFIEQFRKPTKVERLADLEIARQEQEEAYRQIAELKALKSGALSESRRRELAAKHGLM